jgi:hypothetical protein
VAINITYFWGMSPHRARASSSGDGVWCGYMVMLVSIVRGIVYWTVYWSARGAYGVGWFLGRVRAGLVSLCVWPRAVVAGIVGGVKAVVRVVRGDGPVK